MHYNIITGFNIYEGNQNFDSTISYLHSELDKDDGHRQELEEKLKKYFDIMSFQKIEFEKIDRYTSYKLKKGWEAERYFNILGQELKGKALEEARLRNETIIGVAFQNDLDITIDNKKDISYILEVFRKYSNFYLVDSVTGNYIRSKKGNKLRNKDRIVDAWDVPLIILRKNMELPAYPRISEVIIDKTNYNIKILIDNKAKIFKQFLKNAGVNASPEDVYANKVFVNWINRGLYSKRFMEFKKEFKSAQQELV